MEKLNYLNLGCGSKFHPGWVNVDITSSSPYVIAANLLEGIPFPDNTFEVVYHSQVLEHIPKENAHFFISECYRVLKKDGIIRIVLPDLENIVDEYKKYLKENIENANPLSEANYDWILLEMYDQTVRNYSGGQMAEYFKKPELINETYVFERSGFIGREIRKSYIDNLEKKNNYSENKNNSVEILKKLYREIKKRFKSDNKLNRLGRFRLGGEIHMWMYDRFSLGRLLKECGFIKISKKDPFTSNIKDWNKYELDMKNGLVYDPSSLFMEAKK